MPERQLKELIRISRFYGGDPEFVLAGGGNTSFKTGDYLFVKASGVALAQIGEEGFVRMRRDRLARMWERSYPGDPDAREAGVLADLLAARDSGEEEKRPSVETPLHDFFSQAYVVHTHPTVVNGLTCSKQGQRFARELFGDRVLWVPTINPGYILAAAVRAAVLEYRQRRGHSPDILLFQNHGLCIAGESFEEIRSKTDYVTQTIAEQIQERPDFSPVDFDRRRAARLAPALRMLLMGESTGSILTFHTDRTIASFLKNAGAYAALSTSVSPDHIVYCNHETLFIPAKASVEEQYALLTDGIAAYRKRNGFPPKIVGVQGLGTFAWGPTKRNADIAMAVFQDAVKVAVYARSFGGISSLPPDQVEFIKNWEVEAFRKRVASGQEQRGGMAEKIALVTGAAQGFGLGLAEALARERVNTVLADINVRLAEKRAAELSARYGKEHVRVLAVDLTDERSVAAMITDTVLSYGGLDLLVSNAGVLKAGGLEELDLDSFELVNRVNYTAYFLCCKLASEPMKIQHRFCPDRYMDIVQINSKSGLSGSKKNFAYAGSKFGGIGLTQSFALELVEDNIKVNSICPGNFFDGPLWSDPKKGLFVQYLRAGKVPGARSIEDVRHFYEAKVPMKRGCSVEDVARSLFYLVEQTYETGQALPVTGGQIMLK
jgi:NAD(P)-dependent dehydrogenase (short-subunit alcohol dehydrogenase family)/rhamnose utilization protein RhaD (predicted bifunctional aldolase and dehydrogenase)